MKLYYDEISRTRHCVFKVPDLGTSSAESRYRLNCLTGLSGNGARLIVRHCLGIICLVLIFFVILFHLFNLIF